jgi:lysophospholipase L1-like esterase
MRAILAAVVIAGLLAATPACAQDGKPADKSAENMPADNKACEVPADLLAIGDSVLENVTAAVRNDKKLDVLVVGSGSSSIASPDGAATAYPARLEASLREKLPGVAVSVTTNLQPKRTAEEVVETLPALATERKPDLLVWQTGTVDAIRAIHPDDFRNALDEGISAIKAAGVDAVLMNLQYSPRMETMLPTAPYLDNIRAVAQQQDVPLFDRYAIMHSWNETGQFDLSNSSRSFVLAKGVHDCLGRALASLVIAAARLDSAEPKAQN